MPGPSITSANASFNLTIPEVYTWGVLLQNFSTDDMFDADPQMLAEVRAGADGFIVGGYVFNPSRVRLTFQANSASIAVFYRWKSYQDSLRDVVAATAKIISPSIGLNVDLSDVYLVSLPLIPPHRKVTEPLSVELMVGPSWQTTATN